MATKLGSTDDPLYGDCSNPQYPDKMIRYYVGLTGQIRLDILIHEMLHACFWDVREQGIEEAATDISRLLWRLGYRNGADLLLSDKEWPHVVTLRRKKWGLEKVSGLQRGVSVVVSEQDDKDKKIKLRISLRGEGELESIIKGALTACFPDFDEEATAETSKDIARALWRIGYRRTA